MDLHRNSHIIMTRTQYSGRKGDTGVSAFCFVPTRVAFGNTRIEKEKKELIHHLNSEVPLYPSFSSIF